MTLSKIVRPLLGEIKNLQQDTSVQCTCILYMHGVRVIVYPYG